MHILAILFVLVALVLAFGVIGEMLFVYRERIGAALAGRSIASEAEVIFVRFADQRRQPSTRTVRARPIMAQPGLPLAA